MSADSVTRVEEPNFLSSIHNIHRQQVSQQRRRQRKSCTHFVLVEKLFQMFFADNANI